MLRPRMGYLSPARRFCVYGLALLGVIFSLRAGQLALRDGALRPALRADPSEYSVETTSCACDSSHPSESEPVSENLDNAASLRSLHAEIALVCPVVADMPADAFVRKGQETKENGQVEPWDAAWYGGGVRTVAATSESKTEKKQWLVAPEKWFTPGEGAKKSKPVPPVSPPVEPPHEEPPATPLPVESPAVELPSEPPSEELPVEPPSVDLSSQPQVEPPSEALPPEMPSEELPIETPSVELPSSTYNDAPSEALPVEPPSEDLPPREEVSVNNGERESPVIEEPTPRTPVFAPPEMPLMPHGKSSASDEPQKKPGVDPHLELFAKNCYPSARECGECHKKIYEEWAVSSHAYAHVSPMYQKFEQKINDISKGTVGYFCMRCHAPVAVAMCQSRDKPIWDMPEVAREGITCIACHRVKYRYGKTNGERRIEPGEIYAPVYGSIGGEGVAKVIAEKDNFKVKTSPDDKGPGQAIHLEGIYFDQLSKSEYCQSCHQVAVQPGIKLEVVWEQYRHSPACKKGISCQDCHMGRIPGIPSGYEVCSIAEVGGKSVNDHRKHANHIFYGPGFSIAHPGIFPFNKDASRWTIPEWLLFDWRAGWGTDEFEDAVADGKIVVQFPPVWAEADDRYDAREIIDDNQKRLALKTDIRRTVMENGTHVAGPFFKHEPCAGRELHFHYDITNKNEGHNILTASLGAQPQFWANVVLIGPDGQRLWETGYTDAYGDVCDIHSEQVRHKQVPYDWQLFNLQTMFLITGAVGTDREFPLPVNVDIDQLPFLRPGVQPISVLNHPPFIRMESRSLAPLGTRRATYEVPGHLLTQTGAYRLSFRMRNRTEPIWFMRFCDATVEMQRNMNEGIIDVHPYSVEFIVR